jgi:hypothetical protein
MQTDFSRFEALVRKRETLLKFIYERRKGEGPRVLGRRCRRVSCGALFVRPTSKAKSPEEPERSRVSTLLEPP